MLQSFYDSFGFLGALAISFISFIFFIFWIAGIAGITLPYDGGKKRVNTWQVVTAVLIPLYPVLWLLYDMYNQHKLLKEK